MRSRSVVVIALVAVMTIWVAASGAHAQTAAGKTRAEIYAEMEAMFGAVPSFFKLVPDASLQLEWDLMKRVQMEPGPIPNKYRELIGVALSAATKCRYCSYFHTEIAKLNGATNEEIESAAHYAKHGAGWSTYLYGTQADMAKFKSEIDAMIAHFKTLPPDALASLPPAGSGPRTREQVRAEMTTAFGFVPSFFDMIPDATLTLEWDLFRRLDMEPGVIPDKYRALIGVAVSAIMKCQYCSYADTEFARLSGATDAEIEDAVHYAKSSAGWSTYLNGMQVDYDQFTKEISAACDFIRAQSAKQ